jgi:hypothetical protein
MVFTTRITKMSLNQPQRNALAANLEQLERSLDEFERLLDSPPAGVTYVIEVDFAPATVQQIHEKCRDLRGQIAEIAAAFDVPRRRVNVRRVIAADLTLAWVNLQDLRPSRLGGYGAVDPSLTETLAPRLERLGDLAVAIRDLASGGE